MNLFTRVIDWVLKGSYNIWVCFWFTMVWPLKWKLLADESLLHKKASPLVGEENNSWKAACSHLFDGVEIILQFGWTVEHPDSLKLYP